MSLATTTKDEPPTSSSKISSQARCEVSSVVGCGKDKAEDLRQDLMRLMIGSDVRIKVQVITYFSSSTCNECVSVYGRKIRPESATAGGLWEVVIVDYCFDSAIEPVGASVWRIICKPSINEN